MAKSKFPIGVDLGSHTVKVCQMRRAGDSIEIEKLGVAEIFPDRKRPDDAAEVEAAKVTALRAALAQAQIKAKRAVTSVSGESVIVRYLQLPEMQPDELKNALQWEAEQHIPFKLSEVNLDAAILGKVTESEHPKMDVLLVAVKKEIVAERARIVQAVGLQPHVVDVDSFAFMNCFEINHAPASEDCVALINVGHTITSINVYHNGVSRFSRDFPFGGETIANSIKAHLGCRIEQAYAFKIKRGAPDVNEEVASPGAASDEGDPFMDSVDHSQPSVDSPEWQAGQVVRKSLLNLCSEIRRSTDFFEDQYRGLSLSRLIVGGGTASMHNMASQLEQQIKIPVELVDPLRRIRVSPRAPDAERIQAVRPQLAVVVGLALRGVGRV